ncbi:S26 family signal peptidase [Stackebrandtia soli]|uniref:S26 family signal peptidase n=1 Tax=Stackebrandtia soli TaxID=1892856 RepID=UPI0039E82E83
MTVVATVAVAVTVVAVIGGLALWWFRRTFLITTVSGRSMQPTYHDGDRLLVRRTTAAAVKRGDAVVLTSDQPPRRESSVEGESDVTWREPGKLIIKRAVALPGDPVPAGIPVPDRTVPAGRLVILGDNADASYDSRAAGFYAVDNLVGVVLRSMS